MVRVLRRTPLQRAIFACVECCRTKDPEFTQGLSYSCVMWADSHNKCNTVVVLESGAYRVGWMWGRWGLRIELSSCRRLKLSYFKNMLDVLQHLGKTSIPGFH